jgi:16S rRNA (uracil1498-N3)-methyltransferase
VLLHEEAGASLARVPVPAAGEVVLVVGPEGGVSPQEVERFAAAGAQVASLGPTVLRTSTAGTVGAAVVLAGTARWS